MNKQFTKEQVEVYANAFEKGDAVWCNDEWFEVLDVSDALTTASPSSHFIRNFFGEVVTGGFHRKSTNYPYRVTTLEHYKPTKGDKVVRLRKSGYSFTFGGVYIITEDYAGTLVILDNNGYEHSPYEKDYWGVIPKYSHVSKTLTKQKECCENNSINIEMSQRNAHIDILSQFESRIHNITDYLCYEIANSGKHKAKMLFESILENGFDDIVAQTVQDSAKLSKIIYDESDTEYSQLYKMSNQIQQMLENLVLLDAVVEEKIQLHEQGE